MVPAWSTRRQASGMSMKYLMMSLWVTVTGPPRFICSLKMGMTDPLEPSTLPKRVVTNWVVRRPVRWASSHWLLLSA